MTPAEIAALLEEQFGPARPKRWAAGSAVLRDVEDAAGFFVGRFEVKFHRHIFRQP